MWRKYSACRYEHIQPYFLSKFFDKKCSGNFVGQIVIQISNFRDFMCKSTLKAPSTETVKISCGIFLYYLNNDGNSGDFFLK